MGRLYPAELSECGRPTLLKGEVERGLLDKVIGGAGRWRARRWHE